jgi:hypothetical protein
LSADGKTVAFTATRDGREALYKNDTPIFEFTEEWAFNGGPIVSPDGSVVAILVGNSKATALVLNGKIQNVHPSNHGE